MLGSALRPRDISLFEYLFINRIAIARQINRDIFEVRDLRNVLRRLRFLIQRGCVRRIAVDQAEMPKWGYHLSPGRLRKHLSDRTDCHWRKLYSRSEAHDVTLVDIRKRFLGCERVADYLTKNILESGIYCPPRFPTQWFLVLNCDAAIVFKNNEKTFNIAIKYEDTLRTKVAYQTELEAFYIRNEIHGVIYIVDGDEILNAIVNIEKSFCMDRLSKIFSRKLSDVLNPVTTLQFFNNTGNILKAV